MLAGGTVDSLTLIKKLFTFREPGDDFALACGSTVRGDIKAALSYFIGSDSDFSEDNGFALNPWLKVEFENN